MEDTHRAGRAQDVRLAERLLASVVGELWSDDVAFRDVTGVWESFDRIERLASSAKTLLAARVEASGDWKRAGARSAAAHLAQLGGAGVRAARRMLEHSRDVGSLPVVSAAMRAGQLSVGQVDAIVPAAVADPSKAGALVGLAAATSLYELREACQRTRTKADPDPDATHRRIHAHRRLSTHVDGEGAWNLRARGTADAGARLEAALQPVIDDLYEQGRVRGRREPREAYAFDALLRLAERGPDTSNGRVRPRFMGLLHVSLEALTRGVVEGEETCEIVGLGPVPVRVARELLGDAVLKLVITKGVDVANVVHLGRGPTAAQRIALLWSKPKCANAACSSRYVQLDHREPWAATKHTVLDELDPLCPHDHQLKTNDGWSLVDGNGRRAFVAPDDPRHPRNRPPP